MDNPARYGYHLSQERAYRPHKYDIIHVNIKKTIHITEFAQFFGTDYKAVKELNPQFLKSYLPAGKYTVNVPLGQGKKIAYATKKPDHLAPLPLDFSVD